MTLIRKPRLLLLALLCCASVAQANAVHENFVDVTGSLSFDGWNELNRNRSGGALTTEQLVAGSVANAAGSGDALFTRVSGDHYPAGFGLYGGASVFTFTDTTLAANIGGLVFQGIINDFDAQFGGAPFSLTLSYNGGSQALAATSVSSLLNGGVSDLHVYQWDLAGLGVPVTDYTLTWGAGFSQALAFQVDQISQISAVPEPSSYALLIGGLGLVGVAVRRRQQAAV